MESVDYIFLLRPTAQTRKIDSVTIEIVHQEIIDFGKYFGVHLE